jgi:hypothetical protein
LVGDDRVGFSPDCGDDGDGSARVPVMPESLSMPADLDNAALAERLDAFAALLDLADASFYTARAYRRAAELVRSTPAPVARLVREGRARELRGIGRSWSGRCVPRSWG